MIVITDGDGFARAAVEAAGRDLKLRTISASGGNPTPLPGDQIAALCQKAPHDPVLVMVDDRGEEWMGRGERALLSLLNHPRIEVLGVIAVASNTLNSRWAHVDASITADGRVVPTGVTKDGSPVQRDRVRGDTVDALDSFDLPVVIGVGDLGKMGGADSPAAGAPITRKAIEEVLRRVPLDQRFQR